MCSILWAGILLAHSVAACGGDLDESMMLQPPSKAQWERQSSRTSSAALLNEFASRPQLRHRDAMLLEAEYIMYRHSADMRFLSTFQSQATCDLCGATLAPIDFFLENKLVKGLLEDIALKVCEFAGIYGGIPSVCKGAIDIMATPLLPAIADGVLSSFRVCDELLHVCPQPHIKELNADEYVNKRLEAKPDKIKTNDFVNNLYRIIDTSMIHRETIRSIQISDPHIDFKYQQGAPSKCNFPICCRDNGPEQLALKDSYPAGKWGDYECDIPHQTLQNMFEFIADNQDELKTEFITWVGDNSAHNVWDNTNKEVVDYTNNITMTLKKALGPDSNITIFPSLGNHDTWPVNVQDFSTPYTNWPINHIKGNWTDRNWLSEEEADLFGKYGYYSKPMPWNPTKGKVISVNTNACNNLNWWLLDNRQDPGQQIEWLENELAQLEKVGGFAYIIGHIPVKGCLHQFGVRYRALMERYQHVVRFSSWGHTHSEDFFINSAFNSSDVIGWHLITGSGTSGSHRNPSFTVIDWDKDFMVPVNIHTYYLNLSEVNAHPNDKPKWQVLHDFIGEYQLIDLSPASMKKFVNKMYNDVDTAAQFEWNSGRRGTKKPTPKLHDKKYLCMATSESFEKKDCFGQPHISKNFSDLTSWFELLIGNWIKVKNE